MCEGEAGGERESETEREVGKNERRMMLNVIDRSVKPLRQRRKS